MDSRALRAGASSSAYTVAATVAGPIDKVGPWTEVKIEIVQEYAGIFKKIIGSRDYFKSVYMDGFAGGGVVESERTGTILKGTAARILDVEPAFHEYHFVEMDPEKATILRVLAESRPRSNVTIYQGDSNEILLSKLLPTMTYRSYRKGLLFLDPYKLQVDWSVVEAAGKSQCVDLILNFPIMDINRSVLWRDPPKVLPGNIKRMNQFWGDDEEWRKASYDEGLFDWSSKKRPGNEAVLEAYRKRLERVAGFPYVSTGLPMTLQNGPIVYYLIGASHAPQALSVIESIFKRWRKKGVRFGPTESD